MAFGTKTNERPGTRAQARYIRMSASKAREVLDLVRGLPIDEASDVLRLVERDAATTVAKVLNSAVANAEANDEADPERLFVSACYADEGPTLKRFRPRARGRATTILKRTCHITVIVSRMSDDDFARLEAKSASTTGGPSRRARVSASRAERVAKSRQRDADKAGLDDDDADALEESAAEEATDTSTSATDEVTTQEAGDDVEVEDGAVDNAEGDEVEVADADAVDDDAENGNAEAKEAD